MTHPSLVSIFLVIAVIGGVPLWAQGGAESTKNAKAKAREYFINGTTLQLQGNRHAEAILEFQESLKYDTSSATLTAIARSFLEMRKLDRAEYYVRQSIDLDPRSRDSWELLAEVLIASGRYDDGVQAYEKVRDLGPTKRQLYTLGRLYEPRDAQKAIEIFEQICATDPDVGVYRRLASLYGRVKDTDRQIGSLERALQLDPNNEDVTEELIAAYIDQGRVKDAHLMCRSFAASPSVTRESTVRVWATILDELGSDTLAAMLNADIVGEILDDILASYPTVFPLVSLGGGVALTIKDPDRADSLFAHAAKLSEGIAEPLLQIGGLYIMFEYPDRAIRFLRIHQAAHPSDPRFLLLIADAQLARHDSTQALVHFYGALDLDPSIVEAWIQIALIYDSQGKTDSSDQAYERVLQIDPRNMFACNNYAYALAIRGKDLERARDLSWTAVQQNPQNAAYLDTYAWVLFQLGELDRALKYIEKAIELGGNATHYEHLGDILERSGDLDGAVRAWTTALEKDAERTYLRSKIDQYR